MDVWGQLKHFKRSEAWGDPDKMDRDLLLQLDLFRHVINLPFQVTRGYAMEGHAENSFHYKGRAVDGRFLDPTTRGPLSVAETILIALRAPFGGVGIYTHWAGGPGLHFDNRVATYDRKIWTSEAPGEYQNLSLAFLSKYLINSNPS